MTLDARSLDRAIPAEVRQLCKRLAEGGYRAWVVGGCVRDVLLAGLASGAGADHVRNDWDIATDARPHQVQKLFRRVIPTGIKHGTVSVLMGKTPYEVTTLRGETTYTDGRRPDSVYFVDDIVDDLARRDFTVNAMAYDPIAARLIDPFDGAVDLAKRLLRAVGNPEERFAEDGLRVLRGARFAATLELSIDPATERAIEPSLDSYRKVSAERIRDEWMKTMQASRPSRAFEIMKDHGMLAVTAPEMLESVGCEQNRYHAFDVWGHAMACLDNCPPSAPLRVAGLLHDVGKPRSRKMSDKTKDWTFYEHERIGAEMTDPMLQRLKFSNDERERIVALVRHHLICYEASWSDAAVRRWVRRVTPELLEDLYLLNAADVTAKGRDAAEDLDRLESLKKRVEKVLSEGTAISVRDLAVNGHDLMKKLGLPAGPLLGKILRQLLEEVTDQPSLNEAELLLGRAREIAQTSDDP